MKITICVILLLSIGRFVYGQSNYGFRPMSRGGHFISNGRYQNQAMRPQPSQNYYNEPYPANDNYNYQQQPRASSNNVISNHAENTYGNSAVNSIINSRYLDSGVNSIVNASPGSSNNVIGNSAYNTFPRGGGSIGSLLDNPKLVYFSFVQR